MFKHIVLLLVIVGVLLALALTLNRSEINKIYKIEITGNEYLPKENYIKFAKLDSLYESNINISLIHDRLEKHPYIKNVDVVIQERGIVQVQIYETTIEAMLLKENGQLLLTSNAQLIPFLPNTINVDVPIIVNYKQKKNTKLFNSVTNDESLMRALTIITTAQFVDEELFRKISSINLNYGKNISLDITNIKFPVLFGLNNEVKKTVYLSKVLKELKDKKIKNYLQYLDLRFDN
ncbi:MAG: hypothetical protein V3V16_11600, partial [Melioribacteraceae bacterium]